MDAIKLILNEDGVAELYNDTYDITIHCESEAEQNAVIEMLKRSWIPVKWHYITDEEREREGYPEEWVVYLDCEMPSDGQTILVTNKHNGEVFEDVCYEDGEFSLDSGHSWVDDVVAWMPLPEPYRGEHGQN